MASASQHGPKRLFRVLIAGGILAAAWVAVDAITHSEPAAAASSIDLLPDGDSVDSLLDSTTSLVTTITTPVVTTVVEPVTTAVATPVAPIVREATAPVSTIVTSVATPLEPVLTPIVTTVDGIAGPVLEPVVAIVAPAVLEPLATVIEPVTVLDTAVELAQVAQAVPTVAPNGTILAAGGAVVLGAVLAALVTPLLPAPSNGGPLGVPLAPAAPTGSNSSSSVALYGELNSGVPAGVGAFGTGGADVDDLPSSPTFASDTTPD